MQFSVSSQLRHGTMGWRMGFATLSLYDLGFFDSSACPGSRGFGIRMGPGGPLSYRCRHRTLGFLPLEWGPGDHLSIPHRLPHRFRDFEDLGVGSIPTAAASTPTTSWARPLRGPFMWAYGRARRRNRRRWTRRTAGQSRNRGTDIWATFGPIGAPFSPR